MTGRPSFHRQIERIATDAGASAVALALFDYGHRVGSEYDADRWFHAASTIKVPVLLGVFDAIEHGRLHPKSRVHVRNRFLSVVDGSPYRVEASRDANAEVQGAVGRMLQVKELAHHMIVTSSNLATNLLIEIVGLDQIRATLDRLGLRGIELRRGVEDMVAWEAGINNRVTASGLLRALRVLQDGDAFSEELTGEMMDILHAQEFRSGIPAGLPDDARVAHKTGEISTVAHDAGIVFLPEREPYVLVILTEWEPDEGKRRETIASISRAAYEHLTEGEEDA